MGQAPDSADLRDLFANPERREELQGHVFDANPQFEVFKIFPHISVYFAPRFFKFNLCLSTTYFCLYRMETRVYRSFLRVTMATLFSPARQLVLLLLLSLLTLVLLKITQAKMVLKTTKTNDAGTDHGCLWHGYCLFRLPPLFLSSIHVCVCVCVCVCRTLQNWFHYVCFSFLHVAPLASSYSAS